MRTTDLLTLHCVSIVALCLTAGLAQADSVLLGASADNTMYSEDGAASNGAGEHFFTGSTDNSDLRRGLIAFDIAASIPAGSTITSATLTLFITRTRTGDQSVALHKVLADWGEGTSVGAGEEGAGAAATTDDATWTHRKWPATTWTSNGGDYTGTASATTLAGGQNQDAVWSSAGMVADIQAWLDTPASDFGWIVIGNEIDTKVTKRFASRQHGTSSRRPELEVVFTPPAPTGACCATDGSCSLVLDPGGSCTGTYQGAATVCDPNPCPQPTGACCIADASATCNDVTEEACDTAGGSFQGDFSTCGGTACPVIPTPFVDPLPLPAPATPITGSIGGVASYDLAMREVQQNLHSELPDTTVWGFGDGVSGAGYPGPTIEASTGNAVTVNWINDLRDTSVGGDPLRSDHYLPVDTCPHGAEDNAKAVVHLHGGHVPPEVDGYPEATFLPGFDDTYVYPNNQDAATLWYHDHALGITRLNVYMGLAGFYLVRDAVEAALNLPSGEYEIPLAIQDRSFNVDGSLKYPVIWQDMFLGETMLVNGKVWPRHDVKQGKYRLRLLAGTNTRTLTLQFCPGVNESPCTSPATFQLIGAEGGLLPVPQPLTEITIGPGERADVVVDFAPYAASSSVYLVNSAPAPYPGTPGEGVLPDVMRFDVLGVAGHTDPLPAALRTMEVLNEGDAVEHRTLELMKGPGDACSPFAWEVVTTDGLNGAVLGSRWDDVTEEPVLGDTEVWSFINRSGMMHPMHMHLVFFQVLDREAFTEVGGLIVPSGVKVPPPAHEAGWKDTVKVGPDEIVRVIARFEDYEGLFPYHCHILEHEDHEMMRQFQVVPEPSGIAGLAAGAAFLAWLARRRERRG